MSENSGQLGYATVHQNIVFWMAEKKRSFDEVMDDNGLRSFLEMIQPLTEQLIKRLRSDIEPAPETHAVAQDTDMLIPWVANAELKGVNQEGRFDLYKRLLIHEGKSGLVPQLESETFKILDCCHDPNHRDENWDRRGLVYGHVQSGKTANYVGLINRAFDMGYRVVIVLTGMTEDLRQQTQDRIDSGVIGKQNARPIGIGALSGFNSLEKIAPATTREDDLSKSDSWINQNIEAKSDRSIWVIKKNKAVLENLIQWLNKQREDGYSKILNTPFLIIDDEADNASIRSMSKKEFDTWDKGMEISSAEDQLSAQEEKDLQKAKEQTIKAINRNIRVALSMIGQKTFIGYTATPYSIMAQEKKDFERTIEVRGETYQIDQDSDLFPEHFIIPIKAGKTYLGIERLFNSIKSKNLPVVVELDSNGFAKSTRINCFPKKDDYSFQELPACLRKSIDYFFLACVVREFRGILDHNSFLVHTSHLTKHADYLAHKIDEYTRLTLTRLKVNDPGDDLLTRLNSLLAKVQVVAQSELFAEYFDAEFYSYPAKISKEDVLRVYDKLEVVSYHSNKDANLKHHNRTLNYNLRGKDGSKIHKNYIVVGGNRLSRGLTIEGLSVTYFTRPSTRQDSLYQMGRWFGYRNGYEDVVRIFMPRAQINWFTGVFKLEMTLREQWEHSGEEQPIMPRDAVIQLAIHTPQSLAQKYPAICDPNKLRNMREHPISIVGSSRTIRVSNDSKEQEINFELVKDFIVGIHEDVGTKICNNREIANLLGDNNAVKAEIGYSSSLNFMNVASDHVIGFFEKFQTPQVENDKVALWASFLKRNKSLISLFSVGIVRKKSGQTIGSISPNNSLSPIELQSVIRGAQPDGANLNFEKLVDRTKDNSFDLVEQFPSEFAKIELKDLTELRKRLRRNSDMPLLLIYLVQERGKSLVFPLLYIEMPFFKGVTQGVNLIKRKR
jgi:hypothetical protein